MRGAERQQSKLFSYVSPEQRIPPQHPIRTIRQLVDRALAALSRRFDALYAAGGRPSIPPEQLLRALLLQVLFTVRSERQLMERIDYDMMFRWFVGLELDEPVWDVTVFTKNRDRLLAGDIARGFFQAVLQEAQGRHLLSPEHFTIDGTLVRAWAGQKSFQQRRGWRRPARDEDPGNPTVDFHGERRSNLTHQSTTDPEARLAKKGAGHEAHLAYQGHVLMENRHGLAVGAALTSATGTAERDAAEQLLRSLARHRGPASAAPSWSRGCSSLPPPRTIWCGCNGSSPPEVPPEVSLGRGSGAAAPPNPRRKPPASRLWAKPSLPERPEITNAPFFRILLEVIRRPLLFPYLHAGAPSCVAGAIGVLPMKIAQVVAVLVLDIVAVQPSAVIVTVGMLLPTVTVNGSQPILPFTTLMYLTESAKTASSAVTRFRRSDFIEATYASSNEEDLNGEPPDPNGEPTTTSPTIPITTPMRSHVANHNHSAR